MAPEAQPAPPIDPELLSLRNNIWRAWFSGDEATLRRGLPDDFLAINARDEAWTNLDETIDAAKAFRAAGGELVRLTFPETRVQQYGDVAILYTRYDVGLNTPAGAVTMRGRATEVFLRRDGHWTHPGRHLDSGQ